MNQPNQPYPHAPGSHPTQGQFLGKPPNEPWLLSDGNNNGDNEVSTIVMTLFDTLRRRLWLVTLLSLILGFFAYHWSRSRTKRYRATAIVGVSANSQKVFTDVRGVIGWTFQQRRFYATQHTVLKSDKVAQKALDLLPGIRSNPDFYGIGHMKDKAKQLELMNKMRPRAEQFLKGRTTISQIRKSSLFRITVEDTNPHRAKELANAIARAYQDYNLQFRLRATSNAYTKIKEQRDKFQKLREALAKKQLQFRRNNNLLTTSLTDRRNLAFKRLEALNQRRVQVQLDSISFRSKLRDILVSSRGRPRIKRIKDPFKEYHPKVLKNKLVQDLKEKYNSLDLKRRLLLQKYKPKHRLVSEVDRQRSKLRQMLRDHIHVIYAGQVQRMMASRREERQLRNKVLLAKRRLQRLERLDLTFDDMQRKLKDLDASLKRLKRRFFEVQILKDSTATNVRIVEAPRSPQRPFSPRVLRDTGVGLMLSFIGLTGLFVLIELLDRSVRSLEDVELKSGVTPLGEVPLLKRPKKGEGEPLYNPDRPLSLIEEAIRSIRTNIMFMSPDKPFRKLLFTSPSPEEGKTFIATNLSIGIAHMGRKCVLIDTDMRRPRVHKILDLDYDRSKGVSSVLVGRHHLDECLIETPFPNLTVLPCGPIPPSPTELLQTESFHRMMDELLERFDTVLFDSPPILRVTDAAVLSTYVDGTILISSAGSTNWTALQTAARNIQGVGGRLLGAVLNKFDPKKRRGYRSYTRGYYYSPYRADEE